MVCWELLGQKSYLANSPYQTFSWSEHNSITTSTQKNNTRMLLYIHCNHLTTNLMYLAVFYLFCCGFLNSLIWLSLSSFSVGIKELSRFWWITMSRKKRAPELFTRHHTLELWVSCHEHFLMLCHLINHMVMRTMLFIESIHGPIG